jgi:hypothetical protein
MNSYIVAQCSGYTEKSIRRRICTNPLVLTFLTSARFSHLAIVWNTTEPHHELAVLFVQ